MVTHYYPRTFKVKPQTPPPPPPANDTQEIVAHIALRSGMSCLQSTISKTHNTAATTSFQRKPGLGAVIMTVLIIKVVQKRMCHLRSCCCITGARAVIGSMSRRQHLDSTQQRERTFWERLEAKSEQLITESTVKRRNADEVNPPPPSSRYLRPPEMVTLLLSTLSTPTSLVSSGQRIDSAPKTSADPDSSQRR